MNSLSKKGMKESYRLLLICNINDNHIVRFICNLKECNPYAEIDVFCKNAKMPISARLNGLLSNVYIANIEDKTQNGDNIISRCKRFINTWRTLCRLNGADYDIINIHYPKWIHLFYINRLKSKKNTILLTPWGSDVYRANKNTFFLLKKVYEKADYVCGTNNRFSRDVKKIFRLPDDKIVCLDIGSETIDVIGDNLDLITKEEAKKKLSVEGKYVITCGYNGSKAQNHYDIVDAIEKIKDVLPKETVLFFPFTYGGPLDYTNELKSYLDGKHLSYLFFEKYLELSQLFLLRRATDIFIHIQTTDANAATIQEYLLCGTKVINGEWLRYSELEREGVIPYFICEHKESLSDVIFKAYSSPEIQIPSATIDYIRSYGWKRWIVKWNEFFVKMSNKGVLE